MNYKIIIELVPAKQEELTKMQTKINQWLTAGLKPKYRTTVVNGGKEIMFEITRLKTKEEGEGK